MKKTFLWVLILLLSISLFGCINEGEGAKLKEEERKEETQQNEELNKEAVVNLVKDFGEKLQKVSLQAPKEILEKSMQENYGEFISKELLAKWISDPLNAPGSLTSSPWPDRIEIVSIEKLSESAYGVRGKIIEITSKEKLSGGVATSREITLIVKKIDDKWIINDTTLGEYDEVNSIVYRNTQYGFIFSLPESWKDYTIVTEKWEGIALGSLESDEAIETGPIIYIRHPQWTLEKERQDIPIMILTLNQWDLLEQGKFHIGAAPMGPSELGRNNKYVFTLPARYNYSFTIGYEEVDDILQSNALQPIEF